MANATMTSHVTESVSDLGSAVRETLHAGRLSAADTLHSTAKGIHTKADRVGRAGHNAADKVEAASRYVRTHGAGQMLSDIEYYVRKNPRKSLAAVAIIGFFAGRILRRRDD
jgi:ElaB/YqjD/DUF883 family membrane-anchored ribosome-binding protein